MEPGHVLDDRPVTESRHGWSTSCRPLEPRRQSGKPDLTKALAGHHRPRDADQLGDISGAKPGRSSSTVQVAPSGSRRRRAAPSGRCVVASRTSSTVSLRAMARSCPTGTQAFCGRQRGSRNPPDRCRRSRSAWPGRSAGRPAGPARSGAASARWRWCWSSRLLPREEKVGRVGTARASARPLTVTLWHDGVG
jgi:hypothetical protein